MAERAPILLIDGATGTELERRGVDVSLPLWSARALLDAPDILEQVHGDYLQAGAQAIVTNTFRTHRRSLAKEGLSERARELTTRAVEIARAARDRHNPAALVLGSVSPLEDCYRPDLSPDESVCAEEHDEMIRTLLGAGVDQILIETMNTRHEALAAARRAQALAPNRWMISFCLKGEGPPGVMMHGGDLADILPHLHDARAVGVNCMPAPVMEAQVRLLRALLPKGIGVLVYANVGSADEHSRWIGSDAVDAAQYADHAAAWVDAGATIIGGCCGTTPQTIRAMAERLGA